MSGSLVKGARSPDSRSLMCFHRLVWKMLADEAETLLIPGGLCCRTALASLWGSSGQRVGCMYS